VKVGGPKAEMNGMNVVIIEEIIFLDLELRSNTEEMMVMSIAGSITLRDLGILIIMVKVISNRVNFG